MDRNQKSENRNQKSENRSLKTGDGNQGAVKTFRDFKIWQRAHQIALSIYQVTMTFPKEELYGLTSQMRRAAVSTAANIVEGSKRNSKKDFCHFLNMAQGSNEEIKYLLILSHDLKLLSDPSFHELSNWTDELGAMLHAFIQKLTPNS